MNKIVFALLLCVCFSGYVFAQEEVPVPPEKDDPLFKFDLNLAPNTDGALEGSVELGVLYSPWVYSSAAFSVSNSTAVYSRDGGSTTSIESIKDLDLNILRTREDFLKWNFAGDDFYAAINGRILLNIKWMNQEKYGYITSGGFSVFYEKKDVFNLYPFGGGDAEIKLGPVVLKGYILMSMMILYTTIEGEYYYSFGSPAAPTPYSLTDEGFETRAGGTAIITPIKELEIIYNFDFLRHIGYTYGGIAGVGTSFVYTGYDLKHSLSISVDIYGYKPLIGVSYITYIFEPVPLYSAQGYTTSRWGFIFGVVYK